jgi:hypothetical protein
LAKAADQAQRRLDRAASLLRDPVYKYGGHYVPLGKMLPSAVGDSNDPNKIELAATGAMNEDVGKVLGEAEEELVKALKEAGKDEPKASRNRALAVLARVHAVKALYHSMDAERVFDAAWDALGKVEMAGVEMADYGRRVGLCDKLLASADSSLAEMAGKAREDGDSAKKKLSGLAGKIADVKKQKDAVAAENQKLMGEARALRVDSQLAPVLRSVELFDQARVKEDKVAENVGRIASFDDSLQALNDEMSLLRLDANAGERRGQAAEGIGAARQQRKKQLMDQRTVLAKAMADMQANLEKLAGEGQERSGAAGVLRKKALASLEQSLKQYDEYEKMTQPKDPREQPKDISEAANPDVLSMHGDTFLARADVLMRSLALQSRIERIVGETRNRYLGLPEKNQPPSVLDQLGKFLPDAEKIKGDAVQDLRWAIQRYENAADRVNRVTKWAYQLHVAGVCASLCRLTGDAEARTKGLAVLDSLGEQEGSSYIAPVAKHFRLVLAEGAAAPAPGGPATAPAPG